MKDGSAGGKVRIQGQRLLVKMSVPLWLSRQERSHGQLWLPDVSLWAKACEKTCPEAHL